MVKRKLNVCVCLIYSVLVLWCILLHWRAAA